jgi:hypothetical protein
MWLLMRNAAWHRHRRLWLAQGACPALWWPMHGRWIAAVYGW